MHYSGLYRCSGCSVTFSDPVAWREGSDASHVENGSTTGDAMTACAKPPDATLSAGRSAVGHIILPTMPGMPVGFGRSDEDLKQIQEAADRANKSKGRRR